MTKINNISTSIVIVCILSGIIAAATTISDTTITVDSLILGGLSVEPGADITNATTVTAAGALMTTGGTMAGTLNMDGNDLTGTSDFKCKAGLYNVFFSQDGSNAFQFDDAYMYFGREFRPTPTNTHSMGTASYLWSDVYATTLHGALTAAEITSGTLAVARGGTGVTDDSYDADKVDGCDAGIGKEDVFKVPAGGTGDMYYFKASTTNAIQTLAASTAGYQLTTHGAFTEPTWAAAADLIWSDTHCPKSGKKFEDGDILVMYVVEHNPAGDICTIPMLYSAINEPKKTVTLRRPVMEKRYAFDEITGQSSIYYTRKMEEKTVTRFKLQEGYEINPATGSAFEIEGDGTEYNLSEVTYSIEETISEVVYEDVDFEI